MFSWPITAWMSRRGTEDRWFRLDSRNVREATLRQILLPLPRSGDAGDDPDATPRVPECRGMTLHAAVAVPARDRRRLERLCRYVARPPLANERLEERTDGRLLLRLKTRWRDGTTHIAMERSELIERLVPLIPPPRAHQVRYHGILAPCASLRSRVVPVDEFDPGLASAEDGAAPDASSKTEGIAADGADRSGEDRPETRPRKLPWAALLQRVFGFDALRCPRCGAALRLIAAIEDPLLARRILECLDLPARAPPIAPAALSDSSSSGREPEPGERWEFDQTVPGDDP